MLSLNLGCDRNRIFGLSAMIFAISCGEINLNAPVSDSAANFSNSYDGDNIQRIALPFSLTALF